MFTISTSSVTLFSSYFFYSLKHLLSSLFFDSLIFLIYMRRASQFECIFHCTIVVHTRSVWLGYQSIFRYFFLCSNENKTRHWHRPKKCLVCCSLFIPFNGLFFSLSNNFVVCPFCSTFVLKAIVSRKNRLFFVQFCLHKIFQ